MSIVGQRFAYREHAYTPEDPLHPVEVVKEGPPRSSKVRVRWLDGEYVGLEVWIPQVRLVAPWEQAAALQEDERRYFEAVDVSGDVYNTVPWEAVQEIFFAIPQSERPGESILLSIRAIERELLSIENLDVLSFRYRTFASLLPAVPRPAGKVY